jgi:two-component system cell cycle response regulator CtrA
MQILGIQCDAPTAHNLGTMFDNAGCRFDHEAVGDDGIETSKLYDYDLIILDLMLPQINGYGVISRLRRARVNTPILTQSGLADIDHKLTALRLGADDFLAKPFDGRELLARTKAIVRRSKGHAASEISTGKLTLNLDNRTITVDGKPLPVTRREYGILELLSLRKGMTMTKEMVLDHLYGGMDEPQMKIIDVFICKLRKKIAQASGGDHYIETVWGRGYTLRDNAPAALPQ